MAQHNQEDLEAVSADVKPLFLVLLPTLLPMPERRHSLLLIPEFLAFSNMVIVEDWEMEP
jgi:hypothetical protein